MKIYTKTGDKGKTSLYDGSRIEKSDEILNVLGTSDELSSNIGMLIALLDNDFIETKLLRSIQKDLQTINSEIATPNEEKRKTLQLISDEEIKKIEIEIDEMESFNDKLTVFILPGVSISDSQAHICRTITRRLERELNKMQKERTTFFSENVLKYINRLSDFFFVLARFICKKNGFTDFKLK